MKSVRHIQIDVLGDDDYYRRFWEHDFNLIMFRITVEYMVDQEGWSSSMANEMFALRRSVWKQASDYRDHQKELEQKWRSKVFFDRMFSKNPAKRFDTA